MRAKRDGNEADDLQDSRPSPLDAQSKHTVASSVEIRIVRLKGSDTVRGRRDGSDGCRGRTIVGADRSVKHAVVHPVRVNAESSDWGGSRCD